ncbi:MAG: serine/threonine-protein phosphatase [Lachnospiraceae bacterium]|nr:serine/threonine-protein phosphatase [Lachnospiraceae bacterium]
MDLSTSLTIYYIIYIIAALMLIPASLYSLFAKKEKGSPDRLFQLILLLILAGTFLYIVLYGLRASGIVSEDYLILLLQEGISGILLHIGCFLLIIYLSWQAGLEDKLRRRFWWGLIPFGLDLIFFGIYFLGYFTDRLFNLWVASYYTSLAFLFLYLAVIFLLLWRIDKTLTILPAMLVAIRIYFLAAFGAINTSVLIITIGIIYIYFSLRLKSILIHLGGIILMLGIIMILVIGNMITASAFVSYMNTIHDRNDAHLSDVEAYMEEFDALPWLMQYWMDHAGEIAADTQTSYEEEFHRQYDIRFSDISAQQIEDFPPKLQYFFAKTCYDRIAAEFQEEFKLHNLDDLFLIVPGETDNALILFDAELNEDGSYRIGQYRDIVKEEAEWYNYQSLVNNKVQWVWGRFSDKDDFGFYRTIPFGENGEEAYLCNSFRRSEVYAHLDFIAASRNRAIGFVLIIEFVILLSVYFMVLRPLSGITGAVRRYEADKDPDAVISEMAKIRSKDEMGALSKEFASLAREMDRHTATVANLAGEKERISTELRLAVDIQSSALPKDFSGFPADKNFDIYASMNPAKEVGGDFYDFFLTDEDHLVFLIGDVSGKGVPAALFMMSAMNLLNYRAHDGGSPGEILTAVNAQLCQNNEAMMFVTVWIGILELSSGVLKYSSAGHEPPAIRTGGGVFRFYINENNGTPLGVLPEGEFCDQETDLFPEDIVFINTDGVTDTRDASENGYGSERLLESLNNAEEDTPEGIIRAVSRELEDFGKDAEQFDDITMLCVKYIKC